MPKVTTNRYYDPAGDAALADPRTGEPYDVLAMEPIDVLELGEATTDAVRSRLREGMEAANREARRITGLAGDRALTGAQQRDHDEALAAMDLLGGLRSGITDACLDGRASLGRAEGRLAALQASYAGGPDKAPTAKGARLTLAHRSADYIAAGGLTRGDTALDLDVGKAFRGILLGDWQGAEPERRAMAEGTPGAGGYLVPTILSADIIDLARNAARVLQAGASTIMLESQVQNVARQVSDPLVSWHSENLLINDSGPTFDQVQFVAQSLPVLVRISKELLEDAKADIHAIATRAIAKAIALEIDRVAMYGTGVPPVPRGLKNATGVTVTSLGVNGAAPSWDALSNAVQALRLVNFEPNAVIESPRTEGELSRQKDSQLRYLLPPVDIAELSRLTTNQIPVNLTQGTASTASDLFVGQWDQLLIGIRTEMQLQTLVERYVDYGQVALFAWVRLDVQPAHPAAFNILTGSL